VRELTADGCHICAMAMVHIPGNCIEGRDEVGNKKPVK
jgi:hypothetical protein